MIVIGQLWGGFRRGEILLAARVFEHLFRHSFGHVDRDLYAINSLCTFRHSGC